MEKSSAIAICRAAKVSTIARSRISAFDHTFIDGFCVVCGADETPDVPDEPVVCGEPTLVVSNAVAKAGERVRVTVAIADNPGVAYANFALVYDDSVLSLTGIENGGLFSGFAYSSSCVFDEVENVTADGVLMTLTFDVVDDALPGDYSIGVRLVEPSFDEDYNDVDLATVSGGVKVIDYEYGDVNGDGTVNGKDLVGLRRYLAGYSGITVGGGADANGDGTVNSKDVVLIRRYLAGFSNAILGFHG